MRILLIGNSFTARNNLPALITNLAANASKPTVIETDQVLANGASLRRHWNAETAAEKIKSARWDYVVLQEQSTLPIKNATRFHENVRLFDEIIKQHGAKTVLYLTWARQHAPETQVALNEATEAIATETGAQVVPVGKVWQEVLEADPSISLYDNDGSHPSAAGSYLAACVFYTTLFQVSSTELNAHDRLGISLEQAQFIHPIIEKTCKRS